MRTFRCHCGSTLYFENTVCLSCGRALGYLPDRAEVSALEPLAGGRWQALVPAAAGATYRMCLHYSREDVCNWMIPADEPNPFCAACRLNDIIPDLSVPQNRQYWCDIEVAKRRLLYTLFQLGLPVVDRQQDPARGLAFAFLADPIGTGEFSDAVGTTRVVTGHRSGLITINLSEADHVARERMREKMAERYRTLLGHFRHEIGHYYWELLVRDTVWLTRFRDLFGDERQDYDAALRAYYEHGAPADWQERFVSAYAAAHPWEDWGETWAHYLHMVDTLETASDFGFVIRGQPVVPPASEGSGGAQFAAGGGRDFDRLLRDWINLTVAVNGINRSMGLPDAYPFVLSGPARDKLYCVHDLIASSAAR